MTDSLIHKLKMLRYFDAIVKSKRQEIASLRSGIVKSPHYSDEPKNGSQTNSSEQLNLRIIDKISEIYKEIENLFDTRDSVVSLIDSLEDPIESTVLRLFYINGYTWNDIARELNGHPKTFQKIRRSGIQHLISKSSQIIHSKC